MRSAVKFLLAFLLLGCGSTRSGGEAPFVTGTPLGTSAMTLYADGDRVTFLNHIEQTQWSGRASEVTLFGGVAPAQWAARIVNGETTIRRGTEMVEITALQTVTTDASPKPPSIPRAYRCCVAPAL